MTTLALIDQIGSWWTGLNLTQQIFYGLGLFAGILAIIQIVLGVLGMEHFDVVDAADGLDFDHGGGGIFSIKPLTGFFLGFGWAGGLALSHGFSILVAIIAAVVCGVLIMSVIVMLFRIIMKLHSDGTMKIENAVGAVGTVYVSLPPEKSGGGQITVTVQGRQETLAAYNQSGRMIASGEKVRVVSLIDSRTVLVEPL